MKTFRLEGLHWGGTLPAALPLLFVCACDTTSTVGYNDREFGLNGSVLHCPEDAPIRRCSASVCPSEVIFTINDGGGPSTAVDAENVYFISEDPVISRGPIGGGAYEQLVGDATQLKDFAIDETYLYWANQNGPMFRVPKMGGAVEEFEETPFGNPHRVVVDDEYMYHVLTVPDGAGTVSMGPKRLEDYKPTTLPQPDPSAIAVDATHVYWVNAGDAGASSGNLVRALRGDLASAEVILSGLDAPLLLALNDDSIFWATPIPDVSDTYRIMRVAKGGKTPELVTGDVYKIQDLAVFEGTVYFAGFGGLHKVPAAGGTTDQLYDKGLTSMALGCAGVFATGWSDALVIRYGK